MESRNRARGARETVMSYEEYLRLTAEGRKGKGKETAPDPLAMDVTAFNTDSAQLIRDCKGKVYGYVRVSTDHQDYARQVDTMLRLGVRLENIYKDKKSGKDFEREEFRRLMEVLQPGDLLVVVALDRFGRNLTEIKEQWSWITLYRQAGIVVLDQPILNTKLGMHGLGNFLSELTLAVFSLMAELERDFINKRMGEGLKKVKLEGKKLGRRRKPIPEEFWRMKEAYLCGELSQCRASKLLNVDPKTFRRWVIRTEGAESAEEWGELLLRLEASEREERIRRARLEYGEAGGEEEAC